MKPIAIGDCDACSATGVDLFIMPGDTRKPLCVKCFQAERKVVEDTKWINHTLQTARVIDSGIKLDKDVFNANTTSFTELRGAILQDDSIPADKKNHTLVMECEACIQKLNAAIFEKQQILDAEKSARHSWIQQTQAFVGKLRDVEREKYKNLNISYAPAPASKKNVKKAATSTTGKSVKKGFNAAECKAAAAKYGVPMHSVRMYQEAKNCSYDEAAKQMAEMIGITATK